MVPGFSDDEINERLNRIAADYDVYMGLAIVSAVVGVNRFCEAMSQLEHTADTLVKSLEDGLTPEQRTIYRELCLCGTPELDAMCEAEELAP